MKKSSLVIGNEMATVIVREASDPYVSPFSMKTAFNVLANLNLNLSKLLDP